MPWLIGSLLSIAQKMVFEFSSHKMTCADHVQLESYNTDQPKLKKLLAWCEITSNSQMKQFYIRPALKFWKSPNYRVPRQAQVQSAWWKTNFQVCDAEWDRQQKYQRISWIPEAVVVATYHFHNHWLELVQSTNFSIECNSI